MKRPDGGKKAMSNARLRGSDRRRLTQAQLLKRQQAILVDRDVHNMTWAAIGRKHSMGEKEARETYGRYLREIVPATRRAGAGGEGARVSAPSRGREAASR